MGVHGMVIVVDGISGLAEIAFIGWTGAFSGFGGEVTGHVEGCFFEEFIDGGHGVVVEALGVANV